MTLASREPFRVQLCGTLRIERGGERFEHRLPGRQGRLLFAYLVLNRDRPSSRDELTEAVWAGTTASSHEAGLNPLVSKLRRVLGAEVVDGRSTLRLILGPHAHVDLEWATEAIHRAESQVALSNWSLAWGPSLGAMLVAEREFLPGEEADWIDEERRQLTDVLTRALESHARAALGIGGTELPAAVRAAHRLIAVEPLRESGYQVLMRALQRQGDVASAVRVYGDLRATLRDELGVMPTATSQEIYAALIGAGNS